MSRPIPVVVVVAALLPLAAQARFGQENPPTIAKIRDCNGGGPGDINGKLAALAGSAIATLLAAADPCAQQDKADEIVDFARANALPPACTQAAVELARAERNVNPFARRNPCSDICGRLPRNAPLRGSVQGFDPACDLSAFLAANPQQRANLDLQRGAGTPPPPPPPQPAPTAARTTAPPTTQPACVCPTVMNGAPDAIRPPGRNLQKFPGALGGVRAPAVTQIGGGDGGPLFQVQGNAAFSQLANALERSCAVQHNLCADAANSGGNRNGFTVGACDRQQGQCDRFRAM